MSSRSKRTMQYCSTSRPFSYGNFFFCHLERTPTRHGLLFEVFFFKKYLLMLLPFWLLATSKGTDVSTDNRRHLAGRGFIRCHCSGVMPVRNPSNANPGVRRVARRDRIGRKGILLGDPCNFLSKIDDVK